MTAAQTLLLDTHIWIWWVEQDSRLTRILRDLIEDYDGTVAVSVASVYEIVILEKRKRVALNREIDDWIDLATRRADISVLPINAAIAQQAGSLPLHHGDPLDRLIITTAIQQKARLVSVDVHFPSYEILKGCLINGKY
ncbi:MAG: type II toxin-antitoxin system VapC family toxin [Gammaproteobacteria bacterium]